MSLRGWFLASAISAVVISTAAPTLRMVECQLSEYQPKGAEYGESCSLHCALAWKIDASTHLRNHDVTKIDDGDADTAWVEGKPDYGIGESVTFHFTKELWESDQSHPDMHGRDKVNFNGFSILNGYTKSAALWKANSRAKRLRVYHNEKPLFDIGLADSMRVQNAGCKTEWLRPDDTIRVEIMEVYPGEKYKDTAITELTPEGAH